MKRDILERLYLKEHKSASAIAKINKCSEQRIHYWLAKYKIPKRSISDALYLKHNPNGDPFLFNKPSANDEIFLYGLGLGLFWGEGNKRNKNTVRLGNTDPRLIKKFIEFLTRVYGVRKDKFRFGLQVFSDMHPTRALSFWADSLGVAKEQFGKVVVTKARGAGTYRQKTRHGVCTVYVSNIKLRNLICSEIEKL